ncbi:hypothetical protein ACTXT7_014057 [Hymenolepis weldensis]
MFGHVTLENEIYEYLSSGLSIISHQSHLPSNNLGSVRVIDTKGVVVIRDNYQLSLTYCVQYNNLAGREFFKPICLNTKQIDPDNSPVFIEIGTSCPDTMSTDYKCQLECI